MSFSGQQITVKRHVVLVQPPTAPASSLSRVLQLTCHRMTTLSPDDALDALVRDPSVAALVVGGGARSLSFVESAKMLEPTVPVLWQRDDVAGADEHRADVAFDADIEPDDLSKLLDEVLCRETYSADLLDSLSKGAVLSLADGFGTRGTVRGCYAKTNRCAVAPINAFLRFERSTCRGWVCVSGEVADLRTLLRNALPNAVGSIGQIEDLAGEVANHIAARFRSSIAESGLTSAGPPEFLRAGDRHLREARGGHSVVAEVGFPGGAIFVQLHLDMLQSEALRFDAEPDPPAGTMHFF